MGLIAFAFNAKSFAIAIQNFFPFLSSFLNRLRKVFLDVICNACDRCCATCFTLSLVTSIYSILKITKIRNKMEGDTEFNFSRLKDRETQLISRKVSTKRKGIQREKLSDKQCESTVEELRASENIATKLGMGLVLVARHILILLLSMMDEVYRQSFLSKL